MTIQLLRDRAALASAANRAPISIAHVPSHAWDASAASFDDICLEQTSVFARHRWPSLKQEPLLFTQGHEVVGGALVMIQRLPLRLGDIALVKWAPVLKSARHPNATALYRDMIDAIVSEYAVKRGMMLTVLPRCRADGSETGYLMQRGFRKAGNVAFPDRYIVDLQMSADEHRKRIQAKWRYHLSRSEKTGLTFEVAQPERFSDFDELYSRMLSRKNFPDHSAYQTLPKLLAMPTTSLRPQLFFVWHDNRLVAGAAIFTAGDTAVYLYGATDDDALPLRAGYFLHWNIIAWLKSNTRARWYDLGGTDGFVGLHQFKKGLVGGAGVISPLPPMVVFAARKLPLIVGTGAFMARDVFLNARQALRALLSGQAKPDQPLPSRIS